MKWKLEWLLCLILFLGIDVSYAQYEIPVSGTLNFDDQKFSINVKNNEDLPFHLEIKRSSETSYDVQITVTHWKIHLFDISTVLSGSLKILSDQKGGGGSYLTGQLSSEYTLVNNHPFNKVSIDVVARDQVLTIRSLKLGPFSCFGRINLGTSPDIEATIRFAQLELSDVGVFLPYDALTNAGGDVDGEIRFRGTPEHMQINGQINSYDGTVGPYAYNTAQFNLEGVYPLLHIDDSHIAQTDGFSFKVKGTLDLRDLENFSKQIRNFVSSPLISDSNENLEWTLKQQRSDQKGVTTEFKYMLRKGADVGEDTDIFGVERRMEF